MNVSNEYSTQVEPKLANSIQADPYTIEASMVSMYFLPTDPPGIAKIIRNLWNSAAGHDHVTIQVLKFVNEIIAIPLSYIINLSFKPGVVLYALKKAIVSPIFKAS